VQIASGAASLIARSASSISLIVPVLTLSPADRSTPAISPESRKCSIETPATR